MLNRFRASVGPILVAVAAYACAGDGPTAVVPIVRVDPAGPAPPMPSQTFLDARVRRCPTAAEVATVKEIRVTLGPLAAARPLSCRASEGSADLTYAHRLIVQALIVMKELRFDAPLPWTPVSVYEWFRGLGVGNYIEMVDGNTSCCRGGPDIDWKMGTSFSEPPIDAEHIVRAMAGLIHEARHLYGRRHPCQEKYDNRVDDLGAYGVQVHFYEWLALHSDPTQIPVEFREPFLHRACSFRHQLFCQEPPGTCVGWP